MAAAMLGATVISDASFCHKTFAAGWAVWVRVDGVSDPITQSGTFHKRPSTSTEAEMLAALNGIWLASRRGATKILVQSDAQAVVDIINRPRSHYFWLGVQKAIGPNLILRAAHVKGHTLINDSRSFCNRCDAEARKAMQLQRQNGVK